MTATLYQDGWNYTVVDVATNSTTIRTGKTIIGNIWVNTQLSAHACPIKDGATTLISLAASAAVNATLTAQAGTVFKTSLVVDPDDSATGSIVVQWREA
jgi:hypothetical protein